jgi:hypothetical protein
MRHLRITLGLALTTCTFAVAVAPALAGPVFKASREGPAYSPAEPGTLKGLATSVQEFNFGGMLVNCPKATIKGQLTWEFSKTLANEVRFLRCSTILKGGPGKELLIATAFKTPWAFVFHANGFAEVGTEFEGEVEISGGEIEMKISGVRGKCVIGIPPQTIPVAAIKKPEGEYSASEYGTEGFPRPNAKKLFPSGEQTRLTIANEFKGVKWEVVEGCETFTITHGTGRYIGSLEEQVVNGNLEPSTE